MSRPRSLRDGRDFRRVYAEGRRARSNGVTAWAAAAREGEGRVGIVVPGSVGTAVVRNRIKRRLRAVVRELGPERGGDVVLRADHTAGSLPYQELEKHVKVALDKAGASR